ncbi:MULTISPECIES: HNH endonuclease [unclassified Nocardioides]|uniref:HNH endonuclease n=1 Tax=unclassified Nocardioides TaxID=2615069 RepID=UPI00361EC510
MNFQPGIFGKGYVYLVIGRRSTLVSPKKWTRADMAQFQHYQNQYAAFVADMEGRRYWMYRGRFYSDNEGLGQQEVHALLVARDERNQRQVDRAVSMMERRDIAPINRRGAIPDEVKQFVWQRDGGRCRNCQLPHELQFDHIIPVAMGGSSEPENLQLLCGPCNRAKGAGLTQRGPAV